MINPVKLLPLFDLKNEASNPGVRVGGGVKSPGAALPRACGAEDPCGDAVGLPEHPPGAQSRGRGRAAAICVPKRGGALGTSFSMQRAC